MRVPLNHRPSSHLPWGLLGMLALLFAVERFVDRHDLILGHPWGQDWRQAARAAERDARGCDVLCFGDSLVKFGILPRVIEAQTGLHAYNLAIGTGPPQASYFLFRRALAAGANPRVVIIDVAPHLLDWGPDSVDQLWPDLANLSECLDLARQTGDLAFGTRIALARLLPSIKDRHGIRSNVLAAFRGESSWSRRLLLQAHRRNWRLNRGAQVTARNPDFRDSPVDSDLALYPQRWAFRPINKRYFDRFISLAASRGIPVLWVIPPLSPETHALRRKLGLEERYSRVAQSMLAEHSNLLVIDTRQSGYDAAVHVDALHLDRQGAAVLSTELADILATRLEDSRSSLRWIDLPVYRERPLPVAMEDSLQILDRLVSRATRRK